MSRFEDLENFVTVIDLGGISAAAARFNVSKSVVSRRLKALEARLHTQLLVRTTRRQRLTNEGQALYERAKQVLADLEEVEASVSQEATTLQGTLRVTAPVHYGENLIAPLLTEFLAHHDELVIDVDLLDRHVNLIEEGYDLAIRIGRLADSTLIARRLCSVQLKACVSPAYIARYGLPEKPDDLAGHRALLHRSGSHVSEWTYIASDGERLRAQAQPRLVSNDDRVLLGAAIDGQGVICVPDFVVADALADGRLVEILAGVNWTGHDAYAVYPPTRHLSNRVRACVDFLVSRIL